MNEWVSITPEERDEIYACRTGEITLWDKENQYGELDVFGDPKIIYVQGSPFFAFLNVTMTNWSAFTLGTNPEPKWTAYFTWKAFRINAIKSFSMLPRKD